jgi:hypothetical protein
VLDQSPLPERRQVMTEVQLSCLVISFLCERFSAGLCPSPSPLRHGAQVCVGSVGGCRGPNSQS